MKKKTKLSKKLISYVLAFMMVFSTMTGIVPGMSMTAQAEEISHEHNGITFQVWNSSTSLPTEAGNYYLGCDVILQGEYDSEYNEYEPVNWAAPSGTTNLCLDGHSIHIVGKWSSINVTSESTLNIYDDGETSSAIIQGDSDAEERMIYIQGGQLNLYSGTLSGALTVYNESGTFNMYGGKVQGSSSVYVENGVFNLKAGQIIATGQGVGVGDSGNFTMSGGKITGSSSYQSAVGVSGTFTMSGGEICNNNCPSNDWGTVSVGGTFNMKGGSIYGNTAKNGGGIGVVGSGTFNLTGGSIYGNTAENGGGVYAYVYSDGYYKSHVNITGGSITGNNATSWGGGIYGAENVYLSDSPQIYDNYLNGKLSGSVYTKGTAGANNNLCITNSGDEDNIDYFNVNGRLSSDACVGINLPADKLDAASFPLVISRGFGDKIEEVGESSGESYFNWDFSFFSFDRDGYTLTEKEVVYDSGQHISEVAVGLNEVYYTEDDPRETYDYNVISGGSGNQNWSTKKTDQVIFEDTTITGNIQIKGSTDVTRIIYGKYAEGANLTVNGSIYSDALTGGGGSGNLRVCGTSDEYCKLIVVSQTADAPAINVKNISVYGATLELAGKEGGSALRSDAYISSPYTFIYESDDGINYTYHPYTSGSNTPIGNLKRYVKINNTEPEWIAEVTSGNDTSKYVDFNAAITAWNSTSGSTLKLLKDITTSETITVTGGTAEAPMVLDLNGQGIMYTGNGKAPVITVDNGGVFNLNDSDTTKKHYITLTSGRGTAVSNANSDGAIEVTGGYITGGTGFDRDSIVRGGGVCVKDAVFTMNRGTIIGNKAYEGGGVGVIYNSTFTMNGGSIYGNTAESKNDASLAGGVYIDGIESPKKATFIMNDGNIAKNTAMYGGGVCIGYLGAFTMNGGKIEGNTAIAFGGVLQNDDTYEFAINGGSITGNTGSSIGGGIMATSLNLSGDVTITDNKLGDDDSNVYLYTAESKITLTGALSDTASIGVSMQTPSVFTSSTGEIKAKDYSSRFFSDNSEYIVKADGNELKLSTHEHSFTYSAEDGTITATCTDHNGCPLADNGYKATLTISANGGTYDGTTSYEATVTDEKSIKGDAVVNYYKATDSDEKGEALSPLTTAPTKAGRYWAEITLGTGDNAATAHVVYTIEKAAETAPAADTNQLNINYPDETISAKPGYEVASDDNGAEITDFSSILDETTPTIYIRKTASDDNHTHSDWVPVTLSSRPDAPTGLGSTNATDGASEDGTITGVNDTMEYSADGKTWAVVNNTTITGLKAGTYKVRIRATDTTPHGRTADVTVGSNYKALDDSVSVIIKKGDSAIGDTVPVVDDVLTADCEASNIIYQWYRGGEPIDGETEGTYTLTKDDVGKAITVQAVQTKKADGTNYGENDRPKKMSGSTEAVVKKAGPAAPASVEEAGFTPDYSAETFTIGEGYEVSSSDSEDKIITGNSLTDVIDGTRKIYIRVKETEDTKAGAWLEVTLPARPVAPTELGSTNATDGVSKDGTITGVNDTMEYSADGTNWTPVNGTTITGLKAGTYKVRVKATEGAPCGNAADVTVGNNYKALDDSVSVIIKKGDSEIGETVPVVDDVLTADCEASNIIYQWYRDGEPINGATEGTYTLTKDDVGKAIAVQVIQTKKADGTNYGENDRPKKMSGSTEAVVKKDGPAAPASVEEAGFTSDYVNETFTIGEGYEVSSTDDEDGIITDKSLTDVIDGTRNIYIRVKETEDTKAGEWLEVTLPARPVAPTELGLTNATDGASEDGTITGVNDTMEYSADGTNWTPVNGTTITGLKAGTYKVRVKATETAPCGNAADVTVGSREIILTDAQKPTAKEGLTYNGAEQTLLNEPANAILPEGAVGLQYAIGTDDSTVPTTGWGTSIPAKINAGTYYVWYKVVGDANHFDSEAKCIKSIIKEQPKEEPKDEPKEEPKETPKDVDVTPEVEETTEDNSSEEVPTETQSPYRTEWVDGQWYDSEGNATYKPQGKWYQDSTGWWYQDTSDWYPSSQWQKIDGKWYYFTSDGYMDYSEYRDGFWLGSDGAWVETYYGGGWGEKYGQFWYEDATGWYPVSQWLWINGKCYYFRSDGYRVYNQYVDGYWVNNDGEWEP